MFIFFTCVIQAAHLLLLNLACGGPLLCWWWNRIESSSNGNPAFSYSPARKLLILSLWALLGGMLTGGVLFFFPSSEGTWRAFNRFPANNYWFAGIELLFSVACLSVPIIWWKKLSSRFGLLGLLVIASSSNLLYHFPPLLFVIRRLSKDPGWISDVVIARSQFVKLMWAPEIASLTCHFAMASFAVGGVIGIGMMAKQEGIEITSEARRFFRSAGVYSLLSTLLQIPIGIWVITAIPGSERNLLMGGDLLASTIFLAGLITTLYLLQGLVRISLGEFAKLDCQRVVSLLCIVVFIMTTTLYLSKAQL